MKFKLLIRPLFLIIDFKSNHLLERCELEVN